MICVRKGRSVQLEVCSPLTVLAARIHLHSWLQMHLHALHVLLENSAALLVQSSQACVLQGRIARSTQLFLSHVLFQPSPTLRLLRLRLNALLALQEAIAHSRDFLSQQTCAALGTFASLALAMRLRLLERLGGSAYQENRVLLEAQRQTLALLADIALTQL